MTEYLPKVAVVTGASRGAGKGIAIGLGQCGMTVYVTGRARGQGGARLFDQPLPGTIEETAQAVTAAGGWGIPVVCDANDALQVEALFRRVREESGGLDILHNNATFIHERLVDPGPFWLKPIELVDILEVGLRSAYLAPYYAAPLLVDGGHGLVTFSSSFGGNCYMHGPAYGAQKAGVDKFAADMAVDFEGTGVAAISLWLGAQRTDRLERLARKEPELWSPYLEQAEPPELIGRIIYRLAMDPELAVLSGKVQIAAELAARYGLTDNGRPLVSHRTTLGPPGTPNPARVQ